MLVYMKIWVPMCVISVELSLIKFDVMNYTSFPFLSHDSPFILFVLCFILRIALYYVALYCTFVLVELSFRCIALFKNSILLHITLFISLPFH